MGPLLREVGELQADGPEGRQMGREIREDLPAASRVGHQEENGDGIVGRREGGGHHGRPLPPEAQLHHAPLRGGHGAREEHHNEGPIGLGHPGIEGLAREADLHPIFVAEDRHLEEGEPRPLPDHLRLQADGALLEGVAEIPDDRRLGRGIIRPERRRGGQDRAQEKACQRTAQTPAKEGTAGRHHRTRLMWA